ncbi:MAG: ZIP family metal transporter [Thermodesulfobacteriota bacterium]|nr:ZIP family metal transporter [Thermodesulfobacteriota bacterium]
MEQNILFFSILAGFSTVLGIFLALLRESWILKFSHYINSLAAGLILGVAFFHLFPESIELTDNALFFVLVGFLCFYFLETIMVIHSGSEIHFRGTDNPMHARGIVMFSGLFLHSFIDGVIIGVGFEVEETLGMLTSLGVILHELPEGVTTFSILLNSLKRSAALTMSLLVAFATPLGGMLSLIFIGSMSDPVVGSLIALAGGSFLYIAASDLIPETHERMGLRNAGFLFSGVLLLYLLS